MNIVVLCTEDSSELPSEDNTGAARDVARALRRLGHVASVVPMRRPPPRIRGDAVFNLCEGVDGDPRREPLVAAWLELLGIPYTGSGPDTLWRALDKAQVPGPTPRRNPGTFPAIVKPRFADASLGIDGGSVVHTAAELRKRVAKVRREFGDAIVEEFIDGREFNVAILDDSVLAASEIEFRISPRIVTYAAKWDEASPEYHGTIPRPGPATREIAGVALAAAQSLGCRSYSRVDLRVDGRGRVYVLEVNPNPDLSRGAGMARCAESAGLAYEDLIGRILDHALRDADAGAPPRGGEAAPRVECLHAAGSGRVPRDRGRRPEPAGAEGL